MRIQAPAKLNLCLFLGPAREDGLHELCSLFEPLALADAIEVSEADRDEVVCPGVEGENLAARALAALREGGWEAPPLRIEIEKRIPVAAGLGGGSADAAAVLRLAAAERGDLVDRHIGTVDHRRRPWRRSPSGSAPMCPRSSSRRSRWSAARGSGSSGCPSRRSHAVVLLPGGGGLSTAEVFAEADRLGLGRSDAELEEIAARLRDAAGAGASPLDYAGAARQRPRAGGALAAPARSARRSTPCGRPAPRSP